MKKRILAVFAALAIMTVGTTALAAGSPVAGSTKEDTTVAAGQEAKTEVQKPTETAESMAKSTDVTTTGVTVKPVSEDTVKEATVAATNALKDLKTLGTVTGSTAIVEASTDKDATVTATVLSVVNLESTAKNETVVVKNAAIKAGKTYIVLHYTADGWKTIPATVSADGVLSFTTPDYSPFAIVEVSATTKAVTTTTTTTTAKKDEATSPKTGETAPIAVLFLGLCAAGIVVCSKKEEA